MTILVTKAADLALRASFQIGRPLFVLNDLVAERSGRSGGRGRASRVLRYDPFLIAR
jgi:hypothetical protein